mgnify:CR=1 FL=1
MNNNTLKDFLNKQEFNNAKLHCVPSKHYKILAKINGVKGWFIIDTGASTTFVSHLTIEKFKSHFNPKLNINEINSTVNYFNDKIICNKIKYCQYGIFLKSKINETISIKINAFRIHYWLNKIATDVIYISNVKNYMRIIGGFIG